MRSIQSITAMGMLLVAGAVSIGPQSAFAVESKSASPADIQKAFNEFRANYQDIAGLFSAVDFRTAAEQKVIDKVKWDNADVIIKLNAFKKRLDQMQSRNRSQMQLTAVQVSPNQMPRIYNLASKAAAALELSQNFHVFVVNSPEFNAYTYSYKANDFDVVVYSGAIENLSDDGILALFGHEMGHVKDQAILSQVILSADFENKNKDTAASTHQAFYDKLFNELPQGLRNRIAHDALDMVASGNVIAAFDNEAAASDFSRNCELTADRAAVVVTGDAQAPLKLLATLAYGSKALTPELNIEELVKQIKDVLANNDTPDEVDYLVQNQGSHPFSVVRLLEVGDFAASVSYQALKTRINEAPFAQELDVFASILENASDIATKYKKYTDEKADTDDTLVRLKTRDQYSTRMARLSNGANTLGLLIIDQIAASALNAPNDAIFDELIAKMKADKTEALKHTLLGPVGDLLRKQIDATKGADAVELNAKLKIIQGQAALTK